MKASTRIHSTTLFINKHLLIQIKSLGLLLTTQKIRLNKKPQHNKVNIQLPFKRDGVRLKTHVKQLIRTMEADHILEIYLVQEVFYKVLFPIPIQLALSSVQPPPSKTKPNPNQTHSDVRPQIKSSEPKRYGNAIPSDLIPNVHTK